MKKLLFALAAGAASLCGFAATHTITSLADHAGIDKVLKVMTGDTIELPALEEGSYKINNTRVATLDGSTLTVVGPGMLGVQQLDAGGAIVSETAAVLSVPDPIGSGRVFRWVCGHWSLSQEGWDTTNGGWEDLATGDRTSYPCQPDDIAILDRYRDWAFEINIRQDISIGGLMVGAYVTDHGDMENYKYRIRGNNDGSINKLTFARTDGKKAFIQICPAARVSGAESGVIKVAFGEGSYPLNVVCASDVELDLGWDGGDSFNTLAYMLFDKGSTLNIPEGKSLALVNGSPYHKDSFFRSVECLGKLTGAGRFVNSGHTAVMPDFDATDFTGTLVEAALGRDGYDRDAQMFMMNSDTYDNAKLEIDGFVVRSDFKNYPEGQGAGFVRIGQNHTWPGQEKVGNRLPGQEVIFNGGTIRLYNEQKDWGAGATNMFITEKLSVANGFTLLEVNGHDNTSYPFTWMKVSTLSHENSTGTMTVRCNRLWRTSYCENCDATFGNFSDVAVGGIVPWIAAWMDQADHGNQGGWESLMFPIADADGNLRDEGLASTSVADAEENANVFCDGQGLNISADKTINSLVLKNPYNGEKKIGKDRTLTIASGGLIITSKSRIGENDWNTDVPSENNGTLAFGATAYVYANNPNGVGDQMSWIMTPMVAPYGLVSAMAGYLTICGDQTGIDGELVVNAGELTLGLERNNNGRDLVLPCLLDVPVRIVGGGSTLALVAGTKLNPTQNVYFEDVGGYAGKLVIPEGSTETCFKCYVDGVTLPRGTYGATGSGAANIDDDHFSGLGVLKVLKDDVVRGLQIFLR